MKKGGLIKTILATLFAGLIFVGFAFDFVMFHSSKVATDVKLSFSDWNKNLTDALNLGKLGADTSIYALWQASRILMILMLVFLAIALVTAFVKVWIDHKAVSVVLRVSSVVALVLSVLFLVAVVGGGFTVGTFTKALMEYYLPYIAPVWMTAFAIVSSSLLISFGDKKKREPATQEVGQAEEKEVSAVELAEVKTEEKTEEQSEKKGEKKAEKTGKVETAKGVTKKTNKAEGNKNPKARKTSAKKKA